MAIIIISTKTLQVEACAFIIVIPVMFIQTVCHSAFKYIMSQDQFRESHGVLCLYTFS